MNNNSKRITYKRARPNPLFQEWLEELHEEAKEKRSKLEPMLKEALESLSKYPLPLHSGAECSILKGFKKQLCKFLDRRLVEYRRNLSLQPNIDREYQITQVGSGLKPVEFSRSNSCIRSRITSASLNTNENLAISNYLYSCMGPSTSNINYQYNVNENSYQMPTDVDLKESKSYGNDHNVPVSDTEIIPLDNLINEDSQTLHLMMTKNDVPFKPIRGSGGYALLIALFKHTKKRPDKPYLMKEELISKAQKLCDKSFSQYENEFCYTAWCDMKTLINKGLILRDLYKQSVYSLTDNGVQLAIELLRESTVPEKVTNLNCKQYSRSNTENSEWTPEIFEMPAGSFDVILLIDKNETNGRNESIVEILKKNPDLKHELESLKVGDFTWIARHKKNKDQEVVLPYIVERKRIDDLASSIKDGRFHEQKFRLRKCGLSQVIYLVENCGRSTHVGLPSKTLKQALVNTRVQDGFKVHVTNSLVDTAKILAMVTKHLTTRFQDKDLRGTNYEMNGKDLMSFKFFNRASSKTKPLTVTDTFIKMLLQLKGLSVEKAVAITSNYETPRNLIEAYSRCNDKEGSMLLSNLKYNELNKKVGAAISNKIYLLFTRSICM